MFIIIIAKKTVKCNFSFTSGKHGAVLLIIKTIIYHFSQKIKKILNRA